MTDDSDVPARPAALPPDDALREALHNEVHARPPARIRLPALVVYVAVLNEGITREAECAHLQRLPGHNALTPQDLQANFLRLLLIIMIEERDLPAEVRSQIAEIRASSIDWWRALLERHFADLGATNARLLAADFAPLCRATINGAFIAQQYGEPLDLEIILEQLFLLLSGLRDRISAESVVPPLARKRSVTAPRKGVARP